VPIPVGQGLPGSGAGAARPGAPATGPRAGPTAAGGRQPAGAAPGPATTQPGRGLTGAGSQQPGGTGVPSSAGISGAKSKSKDTSIRVYNGRTHYNEWAFVYTPQIQAAGQGGAPGTAAPGQRSGQPGAPGPPGQRGQPNDPFGRGRGTNPSPNPFGPTN